MRCAVSAPKDESLSVCIGRGLQRHRCMHHRPPPPPKRQRPCVCACVCAMVVEGHEATEQHQSSWTCGAVSSKRSEAELNRPFIKCCSVWRVWPERHKPGQAGRQQTGVRRAAYPRFIAYVCDEEGGDDTLPCVVQTGSVSCRVQTQQQSAARGSKTQPSQAGGHEALKR